MADEEGAAEVELLEHRGEIVGHGGDRHPFAARLGLAVGAKVEGDEAAAVAEIVELVGPHVCREAGAVQEHDGRSFAGLDHPDASLVAHLDHVLGGVSRQLQLGLAAGAAPELLAVRGETGGGVAGTAGEHGARRGDAELPASPAPGRREGRRAHQRRLTAGAPGGPAPRSA